MASPRTSIAGSEGARPSLKNPFADHGASSPFATPVSVRSRSGYFSQTPGEPFEAGISVAGPPRRRKFKTNRLTQEEKENYPKPWKDERDPKQKWEPIIFWGSIGLGLAIGILICFMAFISVSDVPYCLVFEDDFKKIDTSIWSYEIQRGGFGTGSFEWTTDDSKNAYVDAEGLHIVPTLTTESTDITPAQMYDGHVLNLTTDGTCTSDDVTQCAIRSNVTSGDVINPVRSARLVTRGKKHITYGKVEVIAKLPQGDWLWPAIWMLPEPVNKTDGKYGPWPRSGEIDIMESRGNNGDDYPDGRDSVSGTLHWGPIPEADAFSKTSGKHNLRRTDYSAEFHTYGLEWRDDLLYMYIDSRLLQIFFLRWKTNGENMWQRGGFGSKLVNHSALFDPWSQTGKPNTPFDQPFYLILNVAVGGTNGYFKDGVANKPWGDNSLTAPKQFLDAKNLWYPTWGVGDKRGMTVKSVKMWSVGKC